MQFGQDTEQFFSDWAELSNRHHSNNQFLSTEFLSLLLKYFGQSSLYQVRAVCRGKTVCLMLLRKRNKLIWELYKPSQAQVGLVLIDPAFSPDIPSLLNALPGFAARIDFLSLDPLEHQSLIAKLLNGESEPYATNMQIRLNGSFDDYWQERSKNLRKNISRYENRLERDNKTLQFHQVTAAKDISSAVDRYGMLESKGWKGKLGTALHPSNQQGQFYRNFLYQLALQNNAVVYEYYIEDKIVASRLCCIKQNMLIILKTTFDEDYKHFALGRLLLKQILQVLFVSNNIEIIDFYTNATQEQLDWATDSRPIYNGSYYSKTMLGKAFQLASKLRQKSKHNTELETE